MRYHGGDAHVAHPVLARWIAEGRVIPICPEVLGGLPTPRPAAELVAPGRVATADGEDVTAAFTRGADLAVAHDDVVAAILKDGSPSCGTSFVYDGTFRSVRVAGEGLTAALLRARGVLVFSEQELDRAAEYVDPLDDAR